MKRRRLRSWVFAILGAFAVIGAVLLSFILLEQHTREEENYSLIEEGLYMGGYVSHPPRGAAAAVNLCQLEDPYQVEHHLWLPINDSEPAPSIDTLRQLVEFIHAQRQAGRATFVHCRNGVSRSGMVVVAYLMAKHHWTRDQALEFVRTRRPAARPSHPLMHRLLEWEQELSLAAVARQP